MRGELAREQSCWWLLKLSSMSTIQREWAAVHCLAHMPLREVLLSAKVRAGRCGQAGGRAVCGGGLHRAAARSLTPFCLLPLPPTAPPHPSPTHSRGAQVSGSLLAAQDRLEVPPAMRAAMDKSYNASQMAAVTGGLTGAPVVLIQGPPGGWGGCEVMAGGK